MRSSTETKPEPGTENSRENGSSLFLHTNTIELELGTESSRENGSSSFLYTKTIERELGTESSRENHSLLFLHTIELELWTECSRDNRSSSFLHSKNMPPPSTRHPKPKMKSLNPESNGLCASGPNTSGIKQIKYVGYCPQMSRVRNRPQSTIEGWGKLLGRTKEGHEHKRRVTGSRGPKETRFEIRTW
jgi:hypothetical protein